MRAVAVAVTLMLPLAVLAQTPGKTITIAIYAPNAPFQSGGDRFNFVNRLAQQVSSVAGVQAQGKAFAKAGDLEAAIKAKQIDFAVVDGVYLAQRGVPWNVLAIATSGGQTRPRWALFTANGEAATSLQGKKLSIASTGPRDDDFIGNVLFGGEIAVKKWFSGKSGAPDIASAVAAVTLHKADAVFAPESEGKGLKKSFDSVEVPNPAFCDVGSGLPSDVVTKIKNAVLSHGAQAALDGWKAGDAGPYRALQQNMGARSKRPVMAEPEPSKLDAEVLQPPAIESAMPDLKQQYWTPSP